MATMPARWNAVRTVTVWALATGAAIGVTWFGIRPVLDAAVPDRLVAFPADAPGAPTAAAPSSTPPETAPAPSGRASARVSSRPAPSGSATAAPPTTVDGWTLIAGEYVRSFQLVGGDATVRAAHGVIELVSATPRPGFVLTLVPSGDDRLVLNFTGGLHISTLDVAWRNGIPVGEVGELP
jgi:hypothetical protein